MKNIGDSITNLIKDAPEITKRVIRRKRKKGSVGLALGGGAAWGICHIGVLKALEDNDIPIDYICGTSIGSLVGGLYAAGISVDALRDLSSHAQWKNLSQLSLPFTGILSNEPMETFIKSVVGNISFKDLKIPFAAVATDLVTGEEVILDSGSFCTAIRASCSIPGIFQPIKLNGRTLVDGGVANNVPVSIVKQMGAEKVIAVSSSPSLEHWIPKNSIQIILKSYLIMQSKVAQKHTSLADVVISVDTKGHSPIDLTCSKDLYNKGLVAGLTKMDKIKELIGN